MKSFTNSQQTEGLIIVRTKPHSLLVEGILFVFRAESKWKEQKNSNTKITPTLSCNRHLPDGSIVIGITSVNWANNAMTNNKYVRGRFILSGGVLRPVAGKPNQHLCVRIGHIDPKASIPNWVVSLSIKKAADVFAKLQSLWNGLEKNPPNVIEIVKDPEDEAEAINKIEDNKPKQVIETNNLKEEMQNPEQPKQNNQETTSNVDQKNSTQIEMSG